jgi:hypothetical protein
MESPLFCDGGPGNSCRLRKKKKRGWKKPASRLVICAILEIDL